MSRRASAVSSSAKYEDDSLSPVTTMSEDEKETVANTTRTGTPATSVDGAASGKRRTPSRAAATSSAAKSKAAIEKHAREMAMEEGGNDEDEDEEMASELSELEEEEGDDEPLSKKSKYFSSGPASTPASAAASSSSSSRRRKPSPEVVIYVNSSATSKKRVRRSSLSTSVTASSPVRKAKAKIESDYDEEVDELDEDDGEDEDEDAFMKIAKQAMKNETADASEDDSVIKKVAAKIAESYRSTKITTIKRDIKGKGKARASSPASVSWAPSKGQGKQKADSKKSKKAAVVVKADKKGKGKKVAASSDEESEFVASGDEVGSGSDGSELSAVDSDEEEDGEEVGTPSAALATLKKRRARAVPRRGPEGEKLTWWQKNEIDLIKNHPELENVWSDLALLPVVKPIKADQPELLTMKLLPFQLEGLYWMKQQEQGPWKGGMLADEMGMGKTIQTISLIMSDYVEGPKKHHTLILAPTVAIIQWRNEFNKFTSGINICVWHGGNRSNDKKELLKYDIVLTSYAVLESAFRRQNSGYKRKGELVKEESLLHTIEWHRVILDEAHNIKDRSCNTARGAFALKADFRWCLSGTPLQNRVGELYSLIRFLGAEPFSFYFCKKCPCKSLHWKFSNKRTCDQCNHTPMHHICYWNNEVLKPIQKYGASIGHGKGAFEKLSLLLARMMLRRTKVERADDMGLPPRDIVVRRDYFTEEEEEFYSSLYTDVKRQFSTYVAHDSLLNNYANVFQLLTRMRQTACHPDMVLKGKAAKALLGDKALASSDISFSTCRICLDEGDEPIMSKCRHVFCRECIRQYMETAVENIPECPVCHLPLTIDLNQDTNEELLNARQGMLDKVDPSKWRTSTKIEALVEELSKLKTEDSSIKSLVFSQFTSFLDLIARRLQLAGFKIARLQGSMTPEARDRTVKYFMNTTDCTVFLLSLKAGGVALNLTEASRVFIMDPWWNPAAELQAMDRIHRIGQHRPVIVKRIIIENSIESKIVELQKKKEHMIGAALGDDDQALGRLTPEDLAFLFVM